MTKTMLEDDDTQNAEHLDQEPSEWQKPLWIASAIFLLALAGIVIWLVATKPAKVTPHATQPAQQPAITTAPTRRQTPRSTACTLPPGNQAIPSDGPPAGVTWKQVGSMQAPEAPSTLGPQRTGGVWDTCFAHSPSGALLAAFNLWAESTAAPSGQVYRHLAIDVPSAAYRTASRLDDQGPVQFAGYKYQSYTPSAAQLLVVVRGPQGKLGAFATTMRWVQSDWRYVFHGGGRLSLQVIPDLTGYVQWSAF